MENIMKDTVLESSEIIKMKSYSFMEKVSERPISVMYRGDVLFRTTIDLPTGKKVSKVMIYSDFSRYSKKAIAQQLKSKSAIEVVCGYGHDREKSFFITK